MAMKGFRRNAVGPPEWECEAMGFAVWVQCATSVECINLWIAESTVKDTLESRSHHGSTFKKSCTLSMRFALCWWREGHRVDLDQMLVVVVIVVRITRQILVVVVIAVRITDQILVMVVITVRITV